MLIKICVICKSNNSEVFENGRNRKATKTFTKRVSLVKESDRLKGDKVKTNNSKSESWKEFKVS